MIQESNKKKREAALREAVLSNFLVRWAGRFGLPKSHAIRFKLIDQTIHWDSTVFAYEISLVKHSGISTLHEHSFYWEGHLSKDDSVKIFYHLLKHEILVSRKGKHYFNLHFFDTHCAELRRYMQELDQKGLLSTVVNRLSPHITGKFCHANTVHYVHRVLHESVIKIEKSIVKITRLGEESMSKSTVFRVVETGGNNEVVKVDPNPLPWPKYLADLTNQRKVASKLAPEINTLVPGIAFALSGLHYLQIIPRYHRMFFYQENLSAKEQDDLFGDEMLKVAQKDEYLRQFLEVNGGYGYFMPYLEKGMLQDHLNFIHGYKEIPGTQTLRIDQDIDQEVSTDFIMLQQEHFDRFVNKYPGDNRNILLFIKKQFLKSPQSTANELKKILTAIKVKESSSTVYEAYQKIVATYLHDGYIHQLDARHNLSQLFAGLLKLFALLCRKGIAIRDLKAGNIYITENLQENGILDLLDFETAIIYKSPYAKEKIPQPRLGGTPSRGTPSLWFSNDVLLEYYGDLNRSLYLPDLYAIIDIIYSGITRQPLFQSAKGVLQDIFKIIQGELDLDYFRMQTTPVRDDEIDITVLESTVLGDETAIIEQSEKDMLELYKIINPIYWENAFVEFQSATQQHQSLLNAVTIRIPPEFAKTLKREIQLNCKLIENQLEQSPHPQKKLHKELCRQRHLLQLSFTNMPAHKLLQLLFITVALYMNRNS